ncbi:MAG: SHOCT domain-containing protein [Chloroflexota bacterium]
MTGIEWGMGLGGWLWMVLGIVLIVVVVWVLVSAVAGRERTSTDDASQILKARFARGEITQAEYEQARRLLGI